MNVNNKVLIVIIVFLLITNVAMLVFLLRERPEEQPKRIGFTERLKKEVGFTPAQMEVYEPKKDAFWARMRQRFDSIKVTKEQFYFQMYDPSIPDSVIVQKAGEIGEQQKQLDLQVIRHFKDIRSMCTPEQLPKYDSLLPAIIRRMTDRAGRK